MRTKLLLSAVTASVFTIAFAASAAPGARALGLAEMAAYMEATSGAKVIAIQFDRSGDKAPHYHVDLQYPRSGVASVDVDAVTREITGHAAGPVPLAAATPSEVRALVSSQVRGEVTAVKFDAGDGIAPHYDVDVRVPGGIGQLKVDAVTRWIGWRNPAVRAE